VQWQCSNDGGRTFSNVIGDSSAQSITLNLSSVQRSMNGYLYHALFSNATGTATSGSATLNVNATYINAGGRASSSYLADSHFSGGKTFSTTESIDTSGVADPAPPPVYQTERYGDFTTPSLILPPETLTPCACTLPRSKKPAAGQRIFNVSINGTQVLSSFDVFCCRRGRVSRRLPNHSVRL